MAEQEVGSPELVALLGTIEEDIAWTPCENETIPSHTDLCGLQDDFAFLQEVILTHVQSIKLGSESGEANSTQGKGHVLLCGHPGTGKTLLLRALAHDTGVPLYTFNLYQLGSCFYRDPVVSLRNVFKIAKAKAPSILCLEDVDSIYRSSSEELHQEESTLFCQLEVLRPEDRCVVIATTTKPWNVNHDLVQHFITCRYLKLPTVQSRFDMFQLWLKDLDLSADDLMDLSKNTDGFTGADVKTLVQDARMGPIREISCAQYFKKITVAREMENERSSQTEAPDKSKERKEIVRDLVEKFVPCQADEEGALKMTLSDISDPEQILESHVQLTKSHVMASLKTMKPSISQEEVMLMNQFWDGFYSRG